MIGSIGVIMLVTGTPLFVLLLTDHLVNHGYLTPYYRYVAVYWALIMLAINSVLFGVIAAQAVSLAGSGVEYLKVGVTTFALSILFGLVEDEAAYERLRSWLADHDIGGGS